MILISTLRKLAAKNAPVYVTEVPAHQFKINGEVRNFPAYREAFATMPQAKVAAERMNPAGWGVAIVPTITTITAKAEAAREGWEF